MFGDLQCTKVSADLKCARSLVRITEITATLQEQKYVQVIFECVKKYLADVKHIMMTFSIRFKFI